MSDQHVITDWRAYLEDRHTKRVIMDVITDAVYGSGDTDVPIATLHTKARDDLGRDLTREETAFVRQCRDRIVQEMEQP